MRPQRRMSKVSTVKRYARLPIICLVGANAIERERSRIFRNLLLGPLQTIFCAISRQAQAQGTTTAERSVHDMSSDRYALGSSRGFSSRHPHGGSCICRDYCWSLALPACARLPPQQRDEFARWNCCLTAEMKLTALRLAPCMGRMMWQLRYSVITHRLYLHDAGLPCDRGR